MNGKKVVHIEKMDQNWERRLQVTGEIINLDEPDELQETLHVAGYRLQGRALTSKSAMKLEETLRTAGCRSQGRS